MKSPVLFAVTGCFAALVSAPAQDALRNALALQPLIDSHSTLSVEPPADKPHLGPVDLELGAYAGAEINDNVNSSQLDPRADVLLRSGLNLGLAWPVTSESNLHLSSSFGYVHYLRNSQFDHLEVAPNSALAWSIGFPDGSLTLFDQVSYSQQVLSESAISGYAAFPLVQNSIGTQLNWQPRKWAFSLGYTHQNILSDSTRFHYLNSASEQFFARAGWRFGELTTAGLESSASFTRYELGTQNNNRSVSAGPFLDWQLTQWLRASLRGGLVVYSFAEPPGPNQGNVLDDFYLNAELEHHVTDFLTQKINLQREVRQGLNQNSSYIQELTLRYSASYALTSRIELDAGFTYQQGRQPLEVLVDVFPFGSFFVLATENYNRYGGNLGATWRLTDKSSMSLNYSHWLRDSDLHGLGYSVNSLSLNFSHTF